MRRYIADTNLNKRWKRHVQETLLVNSLLATTLSPQVIETTCRALGHAWRATFWNPTTTLLTFLLQVLSAEKTLRAAVADLLAQLAALGRQGLPSGDPAAYCQARQRLPLEVPIAMLGRVVDQIKPLPGSGGRWLGRRVWMVDGTTVSMPDEPGLQAAFPQHAGQSRRVRCADGTHRITTETRRHREELSAFIRVIRGSIPVCCPSLVVHFAALAGDSDDERPAHHRRDAGITPDLPRPLLGKEGSTGGMPVPHSPVGGRGHTTPGNKPRRLALSFGAGQPRCAPPPVSRRSTALSKAEFGTRKAESDSQGECPWAA